MALRIGVGLSRKASRDYQSTGVSIDLTAEFDPLLLAQPGALQVQIAALYQQAQTALDDQAARNAGTVPECTVCQQGVHTGGEHTGGEHTRGTHSSTNADAPARRTDSRVGGNGVNRQRVNSQGVNNHAAQPGARPATAAQYRAIHTLALQRGVDPQQQSQAVCGVDLEDLTRSRASDLINHLGSLPFGDSAPPRRD